MIQIPWERVVYIIKEEAPMYTGYDRIVGLTRGGVILASLIQRFHPTSALHLHSPDRPLYVGADRVLVVDDVWDSGSTILQVLDKAHIRGGCLDFYTLVTKHIPTLPHHYYGMVINSPEWIHFPWEIEEEDAL